MAKNYFIGIGGTGARVAEALIHACAAGYGPERLSIFLIDPDSNNGNLKRTVELLALYRKCREYVGTQAGDPVTLFHTEISAPTPEVWGVLDKGQVSLADYIGLEGLRVQSPELASFASVLFTQDELATHLDEGFRGRPAIGAVVMANRDDEKEPWATFWKDVAEASVPGEVRVFTVGSIFGGTGAAGVPTLGSPRMLKDERTTLGARNKLWLGGALILPYFSIGSEHAAAESERKGMFVTGEDFPVATKAALQFYDGGALAYDQLYLIGDSTAQETGSFSTGSERQRNRSHYVEVAAALSAFDFYAHEPHDAPAPEYFIAGRESARVDWDSLPYSRDPARVRAERDRFERQMVTMSVFSYLLATHGESVVEGKAAAAAEEAWYGEICKRPLLSRFPFGGANDEAYFDPARGRNVEVRRAVVDFAASFLRWISDLDHRDVQLVDSAALWEDAVGGPRLRDPGIHVASPAALRKGTQLDNAYGHFKQTLARTPADAGGQVASIRYLRLFYRASDAFGRQHLNLR
jgi:hypothetical protein